MKQRNLLWKHLSSMYLRFHIRLPPSTSSSRNRNVNIERHENRTLELWAALISLSFRARTHNATRSTWPRRRVDSWMVAVGASCTRLLSPPARGPPSYWLLTCSLDGCLLRRAKGPKEQGSWLGGRGLGFVYVLW